MYQIKSIELEIDVNQVIEKSMDEIKQVIPFFKESFTQDVTISLDMFIKFCFTVDVTYFEDEDRSYVSVKDIHFYYTYKDIVCEVDSTTESELELKIEKIIENLL